MFFMVKACLQLEIFLFYRTFENLVLPINTNKQNEKLTSTHKEDVHEVATITIPNNIQITSENTKLGEL